MKSILQIILILFFALSAFAQETAQERPMPDRWRGLILNESTPEDAIRILGTPKKDKVGPLMAYDIKELVGKRVKEKIFRNLEFKLDEKQGVQKATLSFLDNKLVSILLDVKSGTVSPNGLSNIYGIEFQPKIGQMDLAFKPRDYERNQGRVYPKTYPTVYSLIGFSERSFVSAMVSNVPSFGGALARSMGVPDKPDSFPGKVEFVQIISRTLENQDGAEVLK